MGWLKNVVDTVTGGSTLWNPERARDKSISPRPPTTQDPAGPEPPTYKAAPTTKQPTPESQVKDYFGDLFSGPTEVADGIKKGAEGAVKGAKDAANTIINAAKNVGG